MVLTPLIQTSNASYNSITSSRTTPKQRFSSPNNITRKTNLQDGTIDIDEPTTRPTNFETGPTAGPGRLLSDPPRARTHMTLSPSVPAAASAAGAAPAPRSSGTPSPFDISEVSPSSSSAAAPPPQLLAPAAPAAPARDFFGESTTGPVGHVDEENSMRQQRNSSTLLSLVCITVTLTILFGDEPASYDSAARGDGRGYRSPQLQDDFWGWEADDDVSGHASDDVSSEEDVFAPPAWTVASDEVRLYVVTRTSVSGLISGPVASDGTQHFMTVSDGPPVSGAGPWGFLSLLPADLPRAMVMPNRKGAAASELPEGGGFLTTGGFTEDSWAEFPIYRYADAVDSPGWRIVSSDGARLAGPVEKRPPGSVVAPSPRGRTGHMAALHGGILYMYGGLTYGATSSGDRWGVAGDGVWMCDLSPFLSDEKAGQHVTTTSLGWMNDPDVGEDGPLPRGEAAGGTWGDDTWIIYGGLHISPEKEELMDDDWDATFWGGRDDDANDPFSEHRRRAFGDVWSYTFSTRKFTRLWGDEDDKRAVSPGERTSHAAAVDGDVLVVYGGRSFDGSTGRWVVKNDVWEFDLVKKTWREREMTPELPRSYHSMVAKEGMLVVYGGYDNVMSFAGSDLELVYSDTLVAKPHDDTWYKLDVPDDQDSPGYRFQHSAVFSSKIMYLFNGRFRSTRDVASGLWRLNLDGTNGTALHLISAEEEPLGSEYSDVDTAHFLLVMAFFLAIVFVGATLSARRQAADADGGGLSGRRFFGNGVRQNIIDSLPIKIFSMVSRRGGTAGPQGDRGAAGSTLSDAAGDATLSDGTDSVPVFEEDEDCCPICLIEYEEGDEMRALPCGHAFHPGCVDSWLVSHTSCPQCRRSVLSPGVGGDGGNGAEAESPSLLEPSYPSWRFFSGSPSNETDDAESPDGTAETAEGDTRRDRERPLGFLEWARLRRSRRRRTRFDPAVLSSLVLNEDDETRTGIAAQAAAATGGGGGSCGSRTTESPLELPAVSQVGGYGRLDQNDADGGAAASSYQNRSQLMLV